MNEPIYFDEQHRQFRDNLRRFVEQEVVPHAALWEDQGMVPRALLRKMGELGYLGIRYDEKYGGSKLDTVYSAILAEELGRSTYGGFAVTVMVHTDMASPHLANFGTPEQLARYLPPIIGGEKICAVAVTEPDAGSDVAGIRTRAVRDGEHWVINGSKMFITNGVHGDVYFVAAKTDPTAKGSRGISIFIVEKGTPGFRVGRALNNALSALDLRDSADAADDVEELRRRVAADGYLYMKGYLDRDQVLEARAAHLPTDVAPDVRGRHYRIEAEVQLQGRGDAGVLVAHGDATSGYSLYLQDGHLVHDLNVGGLHQLLQQRGLRGGFVDGSVCAAAFSGCHGGGRRRCDGRNGRGV